jgi:DNA-binding transcriptional LysR family regulator
MQQYDLVSLRSFIAVVDKGNFNQAAELLEASTAAVSRRVSGLEKALGVKLLNRTTRKLDLTESGKQFYDDVVNVFHSLEEAEERIQQGKNTIKGTLRIAAGVSFGINCLSPLLTSFMQLHPELEVQLKLDDNITDLVAESIDIAIRIGNLKDSTLVANRIGYISRVFCASPDYLSKYGVPLQPKDLSQHNCLRYISSNAKYGFDYFRDGVEYNVDVSGSLSTNNGDVLKDAVMKGIGVTLLPTFIIKDAIKKDELREVLADFRPQPFGLYAVRQSREFTPAKVTAMINYLKENLSSN